MTPTTEIKMKTCRRCRGTGMVGGPVLHFGVPGGCFACNLVGQVPADKFYRALGTKGKFFGISYPIKRYDARLAPGTVVEVLKEIRRAKDAAKIEKDCFEGTTVTEITEEQARAFFAKYGIMTRVKP